VISKITSDSQMARALFSMAEITLERLEKTDKGPYPSNTLVGYYNILHKLLEWNTSLLGANVRGDGAHQELIDFVAKECRLSEQQQVFLQQLRDYQNRISYDGFVIQKDFIDAPVEKISIIDCNLAEVF
jgi:hypothetical protein